MQRNARRRLLSAVILLVSQVSFSHAGVHGNTGESPADKPGVSAQDSRGGVRQASELYFVTPQVGWALSNGKLYRTTDGGGVWETLNRSEAQRFSKLVFVSEQEGWAVSDEWTTGRRSNSVFRTCDGGRSWNEVLTVPTPVYTVAPMNHTATYVTARWYPNKFTVNGGQTWEDTRGLEGLNYVVFLNERDGWGYGSGIWRTANGGKTWETVVPPAHVKGELYDANFIDGTHGWVVGSNQQVWRTTDGKTWRQVWGASSADASPKRGGPKSDVNFYSACFIDPQNGWVAAQDGYVLRTRDGGASWNPAFRLKQAVSAVSFTTQRDGWVLTDEGGLLHTTDGGDNWGSAQLP